jgi:ornithine cyclodeaminase/alanine dehydrogenase-like protein (mu-crystallin family)
MRVVSAAEIDRALTFPALLNALADAFRGDVVVPVRHHHEIERAQAGGTLLLMPAWTGAASPESFLGVKIVSVFPDNGARGLPSVIGTYLLMDGATGAALAALDGTRLTLWRTAAASALAARHLAREDATRMVMVGAGALAPFLVRAHMSQRPIREVTIWNRRPESAHRLAETMAAEGLPVSAAEDLETAVCEADLISCATLATAPLVKGTWVKPGAHLDLVGAFKPGMREADDEALQRASVYVDTPAAKTEGGDVAEALRSGAIRQTHVRGDLSDLCRERAQSRESSDEITVFKSVGTALEDLAAAILVWRNLPAARKLGP